MRSVVITGASSGIGEACALRLDRMGFRVFAGVRREADGEALWRKASSGRLVPVMLDVTDVMSIAAAAKVVAAAVGEGGLAGLINNAGIVVAGPLEYLPVEELRQQLEVNVIGQVAVTQAFLPLLRQGKGRIVNIGSISGRVALPLMGPYCASKFALEALTAALRMELQPWGVHVAIIEPASIATPIWKKALSEADRVTGQYPQEAQDLYGPIIAAQRKRAQEASESGLPTSAVVRQVVHALTADKPKARYIVGNTARVGELIRFLPDRLRERLILHQLAR